MVKVFMRILYLSLGLMSSVVPEILVVVVGFLSLKCLSMVDLKVLKSHLLRVRAREVVVMRSLQHTEEVIGEETRGEVHSEFCVVLHAYIIPQREGMSRGKTKK